jgi:hypothetical protein
MHVDDGSKDGTSKVNISPSAASPSNTRPRHKLGVSRGFVRLFADSVARPSAPRPQWADYLDSTRRFLPSCSVAAKLIRDEKRSSAFPGFLDSEETNLRRFELLAISGIRIPTLHPFLPPPKMSSFERVLKKKQMLLMVDAGRQGLFSTAFNSMTGLKMHDGMTPMTEEAAGDRKVECDQRENSDDV